MLPLTQNLQLRDLLTRLDATFEAERTPALKCARTCDACCHGPFDIGPAEAWLLLEGVATLEEDARRVLLRRVRSQAVEERSAAAVREGFTLESLGEEAFDTLCDERTTQPCPLLVERECAVYAFRPEACRLRGRVWGDDEDALWLACPEGWTDEAAPIAFDVVEHASSMQRFERAGRPGPDGRHGRTTIAQALDGLLRHMRRPAPTTR